MKNMWGFLAWVAFILLGLSAVSQEKKIRELRSEGVTMEYKIGYLERNGLACRKGINIIGEELFVNWQEKLDD